MALNSVRTDTGTTRITPAVKIENTFIEYIFHNNLRFPALTHTNTLFIP